LAARGEASSVGRPGERERTKGVAGHFPPGSAVRSHQIDGALAPGRGQSFVDLRPGHVDGEVADFGLPQALQHGDIGHRLTERLRLGHGQRRHARNPSFKAVASRSRPMNTN
jgi:hypothetical protein